MGKDDWTAEDDAEGQIEIATAATSEFQRIIDRLKKAEEDAKKLNVDQPEQCISPVTSW